MVQNRHLLAFVTTPAWLVRVRLGVAADPPLLYWLNFGLAASAGLAALRAYNGASDATVIGLVIARQINTGGVTHPVEGVLQVVIGRFPEYRR